MPTKLTDAELAARCRCGVPLDDPAGHRQPCPIAWRYYNGRRAPSFQELAKRRTAAEIAAQLAAARAWLASGGRPET